MNGNVLFEALSYIDSDIIISADAAMDGKVQYIPKRKTWKTLLIAAVIASLLTVSAAASGWFGLEGHVLGELLPTETAEIRAHTAIYTEKRISVDIRREQSGISGVQGTAGMGAIHRGLLGVEGKRRRVV